MASHILISENANPRKKGRDLGQDPSLPPEERGHFHNQRPGKFWGKGAQESAHGGGCPLPLPVILPGRDGKRHKLTKRLGGKGCLTGEATKAAISGNASPIWRPTNKGIVRNTEKKHEPIQPPRGGRKMDGFAGTAIILQRTRGKKTYRNNRQKAETGQGGRLPREGKHLVCLMGKKRSPGKKKSKSRGPGRRRTAGNGRTKELEVNRPESTSDGEENP